MSKPYLTLVAGTPGEFKVPGGKKKVRLKGDCPPLAWGKPDSPQRPLCSCCHGPLPEVPLMMWTHDGAAIQLCEECVPKCFEVVDV